MSNANTNSNWQLKMHDAASMRKQGAALLHQRVKLLAEVFDDAQFQAWCKDTGTIDVDYMDDHLNDVAMDFMTLVAVLNDYPTEEEWKKHNIRELAAMVIESQRKPKPEGSGRVNWKALAETMKAENEHLKEKVAILERTIELLGSRQPVTA